MNERHYTSKYIIITTTLLAAINALVIYVYYQMATPYINTYKSMIDRHQEVFKHCNNKQCILLTDKSTDITLKEHELEPLLQIGQLCISKDYNLIIKHKSYVIEIESNNYFDSIVRVHILLNLLFLAFFSYIYYKIVYVGNRQYMMGMVGRDSAISDKYMRILNENLHHELNTPVAIISGKISKVESEILKGMKDSLTNKTYISTVDLDSFKLIHNAVEQIKVVMDRMSNFKQIKYSNGNKSVYDILYYAGQAMTVFNKSNFTLQIDEDFKYYTLDHKKMSNGDLLNIVSNHLRNSIEATSSKILFQCKVFRNQMYMFIVDNGDGIRDPRSGVIINEKDYDKIFLPYYTSKDSDGKQLSCKKNCSLLTKLYNRFLKSEENKAVRGVGLYLNRQILLEAEGDLKLKETSSIGTVFELTFKIEKKFQDK